MMMMMIMLDTANLPTNIVDFGGFDSSIMLFLRGGILMSMGDFPDSLTRAMLVGTMLVGKSGVSWFACFWIPGSWSVSACLSLGSKFQFPSQYLS